MFDFHLSPLEEVQAWGNPPDLRLSWFGFTEGSYRIKVGSEYLLNYSNEFVAYWNQKFPKASNKSLVDYYVVRLWEDILDMLPHVLEPLPNPIVSLFSKNEMAWFEWEQNAICWVEDQPDEDQAIEIFEDAIWWQRVRCLDAGYLQNSPRIWIWSTPQWVIVSWDNSDIAVDGMCVWSVGRGHYRMQRSEFIDEVCSFHNKLMGQMAERVERIEKHWDRPEVYVDTQHLRYEQNDRGTWLDNALKSSSSVAWDDVMAAVDTISA